MGAEAVEFVDELPAGTGRGRGHRAAYLDRLEAKPNEWAKLPIQASALSTVRARWGNRGFEFTVRNGVPYGRFVGVER